MAENWEPPASSLAKNLKYLLQQHGYSYKDVQQKTGGAVTAKTIGNMVNEVGSAGIANVEAVAQVFGLHGWHLIMPNLISDLTSDSGIRALYESYVKASEEGRRHIERVAERESEYRRTADE